MSKQAYYKKLKVHKIKDLQTEIIKKLIKPLRRAMTRYGAYKLYLDIKDGLIKNNIKMGRDAFYKFLKQHRLLVPKTKQYTSTTNSKHFFRKAPNLIKDVVPTRAEQIWVTDITYIKLENNHAYLALVTDLYSKKIMGYKLDINMKVGLVKQALNMAYNNRSFNYDSIIHHSDRGIQYCCPDYCEFAKTKGMIMSTTEKYDPYENAVAERINGILKYEFGLIRTIPNLEIANKMLSEAVELYNNKRRHYSLEMQTPTSAHYNQNHQYRSYRKKLKIAA